MSALGVGVRTLNRRQWLDEQIGRGGGGVKNQFQRESRYLVIKRGDLRGAAECYGIPLDDLEAMQRVCRAVEDYRGERGASPLECVVVESGWPEYEPTWMAIEARAQPEDVTP